MCTSNFVQKMYNFLNLYIKYTAVTMYLNVLLFDELFMWVCKCVYSENIVE